MCVYKLILFTDKCDQNIECIDTSDEVGCSCNKDQFKCKYYDNDPVTCEKDYFGNIIGCIPINQYQDDIVQCPDGSDESQFKTFVQCDRNHIIVSRSLNITEHSNTNISFNNNSTCYHVSSLTCSTNDCDASDSICISSVSIDSTGQCNRIFQCDDGSLGLAFQFCNNKLDCPDNSDEKHNNPGFKCVGFESQKTCVLPQRNLYDDVAQCSDESDLCRNNSCFECFDRRLLISSKQVCDGVFDCYDWSDECLCEINFDKHLCSARFQSNDFVKLGCEENQNSSVNDNIEFSSFDNVNIDEKSSKKFCQTRFDNNFEATLCDGRPECRDFSDECDCENPPEFCNDACHDILLVGDRYCDGIEDEFYKIINKSNCPKGFDEIHCPKRFKCKNGNKVSVDINKKCNGKKDCDDNSDEKHCVYVREQLFSSEQEMIASPVLKACFWIMGVAAICGNLLVFFYTIRFLQQTKLNKSNLNHKIIILNIAVADFIIGIYLLTIAIYSAYFSGYYNKVDYEWRSSLRCSIIGSLAVMSSQASCLLMVMLTAFRLRTIYKPFSSLSSTYKNKIGLALVFLWLISFTIAVFPVFPFASYYFVHSAKIFNRFSQFDEWDTTKISKFACRLSNLINISAQNNDSNFDLTQEFFQNKFPEYSLDVLFGYYGQTSVCMPRFFLVRGENAWEYSFAVICINFVCFLIIAISYIVIYILSTKRKYEKSNQQRQKKNATTQKRICRIIISDFLCWIPICITAFVKFSGVYVDDVVYVVSAGLLLPINSVLNPFLYSSLYDKLKDKFKLFKK